MTLKPLISIVLPVRNEGDNLVMVCRSISQQVYKDLFEVVLVDDSVPQYEEYVSQCLEVLNKAGIRAKWLRGSGTGVGDAMLIGLKASEANYVFFLDSDNVLTSNFMSSIVSHLKEGAFVSFLSKSATSRGILALFYAEQLRGLIRRSLRFDWRYGFVNVLYIWRRDILLRNVKIMYPKISLLDQIDLKSLINQQIAECRNYIHIRDVVLDIRHIIEDYDLKFIYRRLSWYYSSHESLRKMLKLGDVKLALLLPIILAAAIIPLLLVSPIRILYTLLALYVLLLIATSRIRTKKLLLQVIVGAMWLPIFLIVKSLLTYIIVFQRLILKLT